jgi:hypothetical protein
MKNEILILLAVFWAAFSENTDTYVERDKVAMFTQGHEMGVLSTEERKINLRVRRPPLETSLLRGLLHA